MLDLRSNVRDSIITKSSCEDLERVPAMMKRLQHSAAMDFRASPIRKLCYFIVGFLYSTYPRQAGSQWERPMGATLSSITARRTTMLRFARSWSIWDMLHVTLRHRSVVGSLFSLGCRSFSTIHGDVRTWLFWTPKNANQFLPAIFLGLSPFSTSTLARATVLFSPPNSYAAAFEVKKEIPAQLKVHCA